MLQRLRGASGVANKGVDLQPGALWQTVGIGHAIYYVVTGVWPLVSIKTFQMVTGPKTDLWLVKTIGLLITVVGVVIGQASLARRNTPEVTVLAVGSAAALTAADVVFVAQRRISPIYLLDALGELVLIGGWIAALRGKRS